ncbi:MAG: hypothetical protein IAE89_10180 [Anaerolineae bacterium]|nr:hypothetical protein [Anaerolineae bacterium]
MRGGKALWAILIIAFLLRVAVGLSLDPARPYVVASDDAAWYLANGYTLMTGDQPSNGMVTKPETLEQPPVYFVFVGIPQALFSPETAIIVIRLLQALVSTVVVYFSCRMALLIGGRGAGLTAAAITAIAPALVLEAAQIKTETLYIFFLIGGIWSLVEGVSRSKPHAREDAAIKWTKNAVWFVVAGNFFALAALTRAVFVAFPLLAVVVLIIILGWRVGRGSVLLLVMAYLSIMLVWTVYNYAAQGRLVFGGYGFTSFVYLGAAGWDDPGAVDDQLGITGAAGENAGAIITNAAQEAILSDIPAYLGHRVQELTGALIQPHATEYFGGESLKNLVVKWLQEDGSLNGLSAVVSADAFVPKLALYGFHFGALFFGAIGLIAARKQWRVWLPLAAFIAYTLAVHFVLYALPRYLFPMMPLWWVLAGVGLAACWKALTPTPSSSI